MLNASFISLRDIKSKLNSLHKMQQGKQMSTAMNSTPKSHMTTFKYKQLIADSSQNVHQTDQGRMSAKHLYCNTGYKSSRRIKWSAGTPKTVKLNDCHLTQVDKLLHKKMLSVFPRTYIKHRGGVIGRFLSSMLSTIWHNASDGHGDDTAT